MLLDRSLPLGCSAIHVVPGNCHTWHNVSAFKGTWNATVVSLHEDMEFIHTDCTPYEGNNWPGGKFVVDSTKGTAGIGQFGFKPGDDDDFNSMYALTLIRTDESPDAAARRRAATAGSLRGGKDVDTAGHRRLLPHGQMGCVFVIGAAGPAMPDVRAEEYNGAICMWKRNPGVGENYFLDFAEY